MQRVRTHPNDIWQECQGDDAMYCTHPFDVVPIVSTLSFKVALFILTSLYSLIQAQSLETSTCRLFETVYSIYCKKKKNGTVSGNCDHSNEFSSFTEGKEFLHVMNSYQLLDISSVRLIAAFTEISECDVTFCALILHSCCLE